MPEWLLLLLVSIFAGVILLAIEYRTHWFARSVTRSGKAMSVQKDGSSTRQVVPSPAQIMSNLDTLAPYQANLAKSAYYGQKVEWKVQFVSVERVSDGKDLTIFHSSVGGPMVASYANVDQFPDFKLIHEGHKVLVSGTIGDIRGLYIWLTDCTFAF